MEQKIDTSAKRPPRKGAEVELNVEKLAFGGKAVARTDGFVVFLDHAVPGDRVQARITRRKSNFAEAYVLNVLSPSPGRCEPFCPHFGYCGGCLWQDIPYEEQLRWKRQHVLECLQHVAGVSEATVEPVVPSPVTQYYRNKMEFTFAGRRWLSPQEIASAEVRYDKDFALGLHVRGFFDKVFNVESCFLESPQAVEILKTVREWAIRSGLPPYNIRTHEGFWRFLVIREGKHTGQTLLHLITTPREGYQRAVDSLTDHLLQRFPDLTTVVHSVSGKKAQVAVGDESRVVMGPGFIEEELGGLRFRISAHSFFQTNPLAAEGLYETVRRWAGFEGYETVWDLYCGTGSIALVVAPHVRQVVGFEVVEEAVQDAYVNCGLNGIENSLFRSGDLKDVIRAALAPGGFGGVPDVVITDPPRSGMHPHVVKAMLEAAPKTIIAVSCNPATLSRDLSILLERYAIEAIQPFDLFPHTPHIECVVKLTRR